MNKHQHSKLLAQVKEHFDKSDYKLDEYAARYAGPDKNSRQNLQYLLSGERKNGALLIKIAMSLGFDMEDGEASANPKPIEAEAGINYKELYLELKEEVRELKAERDDFKKRWLEFVDSQKPVMSVNPQKKPGEKSEQPGKKVAGGKH